VLKWAREHDCPWDEQTGVIAAQRGHADVLRWLQDNGCPGAASLEVYLVPIYIPPHADTDSDPDSDAADSDSE